MLAQLRRQFRRARGDQFVHKEVARLERRLESLSRQLAAFTDEASEQSRSERSSSSPYVDDVVHQYDEWAHDWLAREKPWFTLGSIAWLERNVTTDDTVLEYGAGRSTPWWCRRVGSVTTVEASPEWVAYLNFYFGQRPELLSKLQMVHVPSDWNPAPPGGFKRYWKSRSHHLTDDMIDRLERSYLLVDPGPRSIVAFDGSVRSLTMARWMLDGRGMRGAEIVVVDNTELGATSSLAAAAIEGFVRLDFPAGPDDDIPSWQRGKHVTSVFVAPERFARCDRDGALPEGTPLHPHQLKSELSDAELDELVDSLRRRLRALDVIPGG